MFPFLVLTIYICSVIFIFMSIDRNYSIVYRQIRKASRLNVRLKEKYQNHNLNQIMVNAGVPFNLYHFQVFRLGAILLFVMILLFNSLKAGDINLFHALFIAAIYIISLPQEQIFGLTSPFQRIINVSQQQKRDQYNEELYLAVSQMKNSFLVYKDRPPSSQKVLEEIKAYTNKTKPIFNRFISYWMLNEKKQAVEYFDKEIGTKEGKKLSQVFLKLDDLNPNDMREQLEAYQQIFRTERETKKKKKNEHKSNILFFCVIATALMIMVNYMIVGFFIDFMNDMKQIF